MKDSYTVLFVGTPSTKAKTASTSKKVSSAEKTIYESEFIEPLHMDLKRDISEGSKAGNATRDTRGLFEKYQFFTPGKHLFHHYTHTYILTLLKVFSWLSSLLLFCSQSSVLVSELWLVLRSLTAPSRRTWDPLLRRSSNHLYLINERCSFFNLQCGTIFVYQITEFGFLWCDLMGGIVSAYNVASMNCRQIISART